MTTTLDFADDDHYQTYREAYGKNIKDIGTTLRTYRANSSAGFRNVLTATPRIINKYK